MKFRYKIKEVIKIQPSVLENKIETYLTSNFYRITERGVDYIMFTEDELSNRKRSRSDFHTRIGEGKFVFGYSADQDTTVELIYLTSVSYPAVLVMIICAFGIYTNNIVMPLLCRLL